MGYFKALKENNHQERLLNTSRLSFAIKGEVKTFQVKDKLGGGDS